MFKNQIFESLIIKYDDKKPIFKPEDDEGYIEYKLRLDHIDKSKMDRMVTQMKYRLNEGKIATGKYVTYYLLGIDDSGVTGHINQDVLDKSIDVLKSIATESNAEIFSLEIIRVEENRNIAGACIRKQCNNKYINELRIGVV
jgi:GTPase